ncbi:Caspase domain-containing protein [Streptomyces sp. cf386]|uniref:caspase family protein n=1 Tax=Streptomyces sp. cf386 TaxID=1761904 RepID=UPI000890FC1B|nr:caspase family protein [Streptomyces sp. cf386]SDN31215.1 Caspase domain-containing protein [Streptomyces sp. cf386]
MSVPWPTRLLDRDNSWVVLVGTSQHDSPPSNLPDIPQASTSVEDLAAALCGPHGLFTKEHVITVRDPSSVEEVLSALDSIAGQKPDVVLFYYVGHGMYTSLDRDSRKELFLALSGSIDDQAEAVRTGLPVGSVFSRLRYLRAKQSVVVLDCCFAGRALDDPGVGDVHVLCATGRTSLALYELDERHTGFTGSLLRLFRNGIPDGPQYLDLHTVFHHLSVTLPTTPSAASPESNGCLPRPRQRTTDQRGSLALVRNPAFGTGRTLEGLGVRAEFARRVAALGEDPLIDPGDQRMLLAHAAELFAAISVDTAALHGLPEVSRPVPAE